MAEKKTNPSDKMFESMKNFKMPVYDHEASMDMYRKNMEAMTQAQKTLMDMMKEIATLNSEFTRQMLEDIREHQKSLTEAKSLEERSQLTSDKFKNSIDRVMAHNRQVADVWTKSCSSAGEKIHARVQEGMKEAKSMAQKAASRH